MSRILLITFIIAVVLGLSAMVYFVILNNNAPTPDSSSGVEESSQTNISRTSAGPTIYTPAEVAEHNSRGDCWMVIHGHVYDVTRFISRHPGGSVITIGCGTDATSYFENRTDEDGAHSEQARAMANDYEIGILGQ